MVPDLREPGAHLLADVIHGIGHAGPQVLGGTQQIKARLLPGLCVPVTPILTGLADIPHIARNLRDSGGGHGGGSRDDGDVEGNLRHVPIFACGPLNCVISVRDLQQERTVSAVRVE